MNIKETKTHTKNAKEISINQYGNIGWFVEYLN